MVFRSRSLTDRSGHRHLCQRVGPHHGSRIPRLLLGRQTHTHTHDLVLCGPPPLGSLLLPLYERTISRSKGHKNFPSTPRSRLIPLTCPDLSSEFLLRFLKPALSHRTHLDTNYHPFHSPRLSLHDLTSRHNSPCLYYIPRSPINLSRVTPDRCHVSGSQTVSRQCAFLRHRLYDSNESPRRPSVSRLALP